MTRIIIIVAIVIATALPPVLLWRTNGAARMDVPVLRVPIVEIQP